MRLGLISKLFVAILGVSVIAVVAMSFASRESFTRGFLGYLGEQEVARVEALLPRLEDAWREHGSWEFLRGNPRTWYSLLRPSSPERGSAGAGGTPGEASGDAPAHDTGDTDANAPGDASANALGDVPANAAGKDPDRARAPGAPELTGLNRRVALLDDQRRLVIGPEVAADAELRPVVVDGRIVGWVAVLPFGQVSAAADVRFQQRQPAASWIIAALAVLLAAAVAMLLARRLLAPISRITDATHRIAGGDYGARVEVSSRDEIGLLAEDFNRLARTLEKNERIRRAFMADVSHELRTPLAVLRGELEAMQDGVRPLTRAAIHSLQAEVATLGKLVDDLYELSLADVGGLAYRKADTDVVSVLAATVAAYRERLAARGIGLETGLPERSAIVCADPDRLRQLFGNLMENTLRYTDSGGRVQVRCRVEPDAVAIDVLDSAPGVAPEMLPRLFDRFFRVEESRNRQSGGAGLGLAISRNIVEAHDGTIAAHASPLGGVWIAIRLPRSRRPAAAPAGTANARRIPAPGARDRTDAAMADTEVVQWQSSSRAPGS
jgi:two-component system sensor histidine kinase BaeS